jgi:DNA-binding transcriptional LysR family regulator
VQLTAAGRALLDEAPAALAALEHAAEHTRLAGAGSAATLRLGYTPVAGFDTLPALLATAEQDHPTVTIVAQEHFSAAMPERVLAGDLDIGVALHPQPLAGVESELLRTEPVTALLSKRHRLADARSILLADLGQETLLMFPRALAPAYYDRIVAACERAGFQPHVQAFENPPVNAMVARLTGGRQIGLTPASFATHAAETSPELVARQVIDPTILAELSILWPARVSSAAVARFLDSARSCATENDWLPARVPEGRAEPPSTPGPVTRADANSPRTR